jgi:hypothetical protein
MDKKVVDPAEWPEFLQGFSARNRGRRARFELFSRSGDVGEEDEEGVFESASVDGGVVTITRTDNTEGKVETMADEIPNIHGITIQYDFDESENTIELMNDKGDMTVLHFESRVDGDS